VIYLVKLKMLYVIGGLILLAAMLLSCDDSLTERAAPGDYFPLDEQSRWEYATTHSYGCRCFDSGLVLRDTFRLQVEEALFVDGTFFRFVDQRTGTYKLVRKILNQYHELPAYSPEFMFLDASVEVGFTWKADEVTQNKFQVTAVNLVKTINGVRYNHVIEVKETAPGAPDLPAPIFSTTYYYYAKDVGLILSRRAYGSSGEESMIETALLRYWKE
jgi:hypothetical protein